MNIYKRHRFPPDIISYTGPGVFLYEETIDPKRKKSWMGRGFDGMIEGAMRAFGI